MRSVEDLFTEAVARVFERRHDICFGWLEEIGAISSLNENEQRHVRKVSTQKSFVAREEHDRGSRPDMVVEISRISEDEDAEPYTELVMLESKLGSWEGPEQLKRYASHLENMSADRKTLIYITRAYDPKDPDKVLSETEGVIFRQLRWHDFYKFLQSTEKDALVEEVMLFMEERGMSRSHRLSATDLMAISGVPRAFEIFDETFDDEVRAELEAFAGSKVKGQTHGLNHIRWHWRYIIISSLHDWDLYCFIGYTMDDPGDYPGVTVNLEAKPKAVGRSLSVAAMRKVSGKGEWESWNLDTPSEWAGVGLWKSLADFLHEEDHIFAIKQFFIESIRELREELTEFKKTNPDLLWNGGN